jgi:hypothetical protein
VITVPRYKREKKLKKSSSLAYLVGEKNITPRKVKRVWSFGQKFNHPAYSRRGRKVNRLLREHCKEMMQKEFEIVLNNTSTSLKECSKIASQSVVVRKE